MATKRKTLPDDFKEIAARGDFEALKAVFEKCDINAYNRSMKGNALSFEGIPAEFIRWAAAEGIDVNAEDTFGEVALEHQARYNPDNVSVLLECGAKLELKSKENKSTPFYRAVAGHWGNEEQYLRAIRTLLDAGADVDAKSKSWEGTFTPLEAALHWCQNATIPATVKAAEMLLAAGAKITPKMKDYVQEIGKEFEFYRADFNPEFLPATDAALDRLYQIFDVEPTTRRPVYDGKSPIHVKPGTWREQHEALWQMLVPGSGHASTVQGEVIRITGKVSREILDNGAPNWNKDYKKLPQALPAYFAMGTPLPSDAYAEAEKLAKGISANSDDEELDRLCELAVQWVLLNSGPIALKKVDYER